ncbi:lysophospholipid acyltransferase family protein [Flavilitoribacter nigricans]|uniref:Glycerol acyltransferase n=1 Tax=Flavilitoribacter nigricans (strain ATCC 23147 / DSM 23189 / NBRC 102662 / NCIMB 1420 / SS-2) TaxID=1122177 RepID=A0A2D0NG59_FLAN2|nr:lysophospholipid acyltransferase family protein [Flavilitoribacter nigricans]PHN07370.1 glycerol acyltransferase [Flavilitoribacter nigricans DSM 23189 = NBRC 102662]
MAKHKDPFKARISYTSPEDPLFRRLLMGTVEYATGRKRLEKVYSRVKKIQPGRGEVWQLILDELDVSMIFDEAQLQKVAPDGPVIVIANHPFGVVDGLILGHLLSRMRDRYFVLVNEVLCREELLAPYFLPIDFRETKDALQTNIQTRKTALERLQAGEMMGIFPSGGVATAPKMWKKAEDLEWKRFVVKLIQQTRATVLPMYIHGRNSRLFQLASQFSLSLRLSLLLNEVKNKIGKTVLISIGEPIPFTEIAHLKDRQELLDHLRQTTEMLSSKIPGVL